MDLNNFPFDLVEAACRVLEAKVAGKFRVYHADGSVTSSGELSGVMSPSDYMDWLRTYKGPSSTSGVVAAVPEPDLTPSATEIFDHVRRSLSVMHGQGKDADPEKTGAAAPAAMPTMPKPPSAASASPIAKLKAFVDRLPPKPASSVQSPALPRVVRPVGVA